MRQDIRRMKLEKVQEKILTPQTHDTFSRATFYNIFVCSKLDVELKMGIVN